MSVTNTALSSAFEKPPQPRVIGLKFAWKDFFAMLTLLGEPHLYRGFDEAVTAVASLTGSRLHRSPVAFRAASSEWSVEIVLVVDVSVGRAGSRE